MTTNSTSTGDVALALSSAINGAARSWTGADWTHYLPGEEPGEEPRVCAGDEGCQVCADAAEDAACAAAAGRRAAEVAAAGWWAEAAAELGDAARLESEWGDDPTWGPLARAVRDLAGAWGNAQAARAALLRTRPRAARGATGDGPGDISPGEAALLLEALDGRFAPGLGDALDAIDAALAAEEEVDGGLYPVWDPGLAAPWGAAVEAAQWLVEETYWALEAAQGSVEETYWALEGLPPR